MIFLKFFNFTELIKASEKDFFNTFSIPKTSCLYDIDIIEKAIDFKFHRKCYVKYIKFKYVVEVEREIALEALNFLKERCDQKIKENAFYFKGLAIIENFQNESFSFERFKKLFWESFTKVEKETMQSDFLSTNTRESEDQKVDYTDLLNLFYTKYQVIISTSNFREILIRKIEDILKRKEETIKINMAALYNPSRFLKIDSSLKCRNIFFTYSLPMNIAISLNLIEEEYPIAYKLDSNSEIIECKKTEIIEDEDISFTQFEIRYEGEKMIFENSKNEKILCVYLEYRVICKQDVFFGTIEKEYENLRRMKTKTYQSIFIDFFEFLKTKTEKNISTEDLEEFFEGKEYTSSGIWYFESLIEKNLERDDNYDRYYDKKTLYLYCLKKLISNDFKNINFQRIKYKKYLMENENMSTVIEFIPCFLFENEHYCLNDNKLEINTESFKKNVVFRIKIVTEENIYESSNFCEKDGDNEIIPWKHKVKNIHWEF